jgi:hypothetical protein
MSPSEVAWRTKSLVRDLGDVARLELGMLPPRADLEPATSLEDTERGFSLSRQPSEFAVFDKRREWRLRLLRKADDCAARNLSYFNLERQHIGEPVDWHRDRNAAKSSSRKAIQRVDYRDFAVNGDCKHVWEPNRHHHFVVLARAWAATEDSRYAEALLGQMSEWIEGNPFGYGMNWKSPLELGVRLINWVFALELIRGSGLASGPLWVAIHRSIYHHCWEVRRKTSRGSSANNHLIGELAGVFVAASYLPGLPDAREMVKETRAALSEEILRQTYEDGCTREHALGYQFFVIQFYLICALVGRWTGNDFPREYLARLQAMFEFVAALAAGGPLPMFGDQDDGYVLDLGDDTTDVGAWMDAGCRMFDMSDTARRLATRSEAAFWLFGRPDHDGSEPAGVAPDLPCVAFEDSGYYLLQARRGRDSISVFFDCAELGYGAIAAHGHADALGFTLRAHGEQLLIDPGTYDYFTHPQWRSYFRSTAAHNTVEIDRLDQSVMSGPFMWGRRATARLVEWRGHADRPSVTGEHDGYGRLADPVIHRRTIALSPPELRCSVVDRLIAEGEHDVAVRFHLGPFCRVREAIGGEMVINVNGRFSFILRLDPRLEVSSLLASDAPIAGWYSEGYHRKAPITTIVGSIRSAGGITLEHSIEVESVE